MLPERFDKDGRLIIPLSKRKKSLPKEKEDKIRYVIAAAYCPKGCNIIDSDKTLFLERRVKVNN